MRSLILLLPLVLLSGSPVFADWNRPFIDEPEPPTPSSVEDEDLTWKEGNTTLPPWPSDSDLVEFRVDDPSSRFRQYLDVNHIRVGKDGAVRYTLVVEAPSGVRNVSFEGLRCTPHGVFKVFAYGYDGHFEKTESEWESLHGRVSDQIHRDLHELILCVPRKFEPRSKNGIVQAMRTSALSERGTGFVTD
jgi:hypothetical protein